MSTLKGKRLLVLGCTNNALDVQAYAEKNGVKITVAGLGFSDSIKAIADEVHYVDILDRQALAGLIRTNSIDGIFVGGNEDIISCVVDVAEEVGLPFYSSRMLWNLCSNKAVFKSACREYGIPTTEEYVINGYFQEDLKKMKYPLVIKPVDSCGSRGVNLCHSEDEFEHFYNEAKANSKSGEVIVEEFVEGEEICIYYTFCDGQVSLTSMSDKYLRQGEGAFSPLAEIYAYPSKHLKEFQEQFDEKMRNMLLWFGIRNGITSMQGFYTKGTFKFFEMGYRLGGTAQYRYTQYVNGISSFEMMMNFALTGKMSGYDQGLDSAFFEKKCCTLSLLSKGGKVAKICGLDEAKKEKGVIFIETRYKVGETIKPSRTVSQFHVRLFLVADTEAEMKDLIIRMQESIQVYDDKGEAMLITRFDIDRLSFDEIGGGYYKLSMVTFINPYNIVASYEDVAA
jgi:phosphoribosylaminoimidazole carboxylase (NCAIR synthetase)